MKKIISSTFLLLAAGLSTAIAKDDPSPDQQVLELFKKEFSAAQQVTWNKQDDYDKATFLLTGRRVVAYFNPEGQLEGCIREIFFDQLPLVVMKGIDQKFPEAEISTVREITNTEGTSYRVFLEAKNKKYSIKVGSAGYIEQVEKLPK